ncbi:MAG TPA: hypothetical protein VN372_06785 [Methanospirillum sp.]|nr:hypothetical protein [Methanospirillum sp.]
MKIVKTMSNIRYSDGRDRIEYRLSSPVTREVLSVLSQGEWVCSGLQYLSPAYVISKTDEIEIQGILRSPVIVLFCSPGSQFWVEEYLSEFLSTIPDSEIVESPVYQVLARVYSWLKSL